MKIGIDIDGVLADFNVAFMDRVRTVTGRDLFPAGYVPHTWNYPESLGYTQDEVSRTWETVKKDGSFWRRLPAYPTTTDALRAIFASRATDVYFITARPGLSVKRQTECWLRAEFRQIVPAWNYLPTVLISTHKGLACRTLELDAYIDDRWENVLDVSTSATTDSFLLTQPWNADFAADTHDINRVSSVPEMLAQLGILNG